jgi:hypothetical protein
VAEAVRFYNDQDREDWAATQNELTLDFMKRLATVEEKARQQESLLRNTIDRVYREKRDLETHLRHEIGQRLLIGAVYTEDGLQAAVDDEMRSITRGT